MPKRKHHELEEAEEVPPGEESDPEGSEGDDGMDISEEAYCEAMDKWIAKEAQRRGVPQERVWQMLEKGQLEVPEEILLECEEPHEEKKGAERKEVKERKAREMSLDENVPLAFKSVSPYITPPSLQPVHQMTPPPAPQMRADKPLAPPLPTTNPSTAEERVKAHLKALSEFCAQKQNKV